MEEEGRKRITPVSRPKGGPSLPPPGGVNVDAGRGRVGCSSFSSVVVVIMSSVLMVAPLAESRSMDRRTCWVGWGGGSVSVYVRVRACTRENKACVIVCMCMCMCMCNVY